MKKSANRVFMKDRIAWRKWLTENHNSEIEVWLVYYKKHTQKPTIIYDEAVEEALCFGWIDSTVKRIDDEKYCQKFTPRKEKSIWSDLNKKRAAKLIKNNLMTEYGLAKIDQAKENGMWYKKYPDNKNRKMPEFFKEALKKDDKAREVFSSLAPSHKREYINWIQSAKKESTKLKRCNEALEILKKNKKLGMK